MKPADRSQFEIAIICALRSESDAVEAVFDEFFEDDETTVYDKVRGDHNAFTLGRIGQHAVVLAYLPGMGKWHAASASASFKASFPNIRLGLLIGICGGIPPDIFLGDVIISSGVVQFDFGRQFENRVIRRDTLQVNLGRPNTEIRAFLRQVDGWRGRTKLQRNIAKYINDVCKKEGFEEWTRPLPEEDKLYSTGYRHKHHQPGVCTTCDACRDDKNELCNEALSLSCAELGCDENQLVLRKRRNNMSAPEVHFGLIGSGDVVMKSATHRDRIAQEENILGFEMEAAGMWDNFPTIVVKAVCDYADSHKNKRWQKYASVVAASCMKALLQEWRPTNNQLASNADEDGKQTIQHQGDSVPAGITNQGGVTFNNNGRVSNQAVNQTFGGPVNFS